MKLPRWLIWAVLGTMVIAVAIAYAPNGEQIEPVIATKGKRESVVSRSVAEQQSQATLSEHVELERLSALQNKVNTSKGGANAFNSTSWYVAPPPPPKLVLPPPPPEPLPTAPPLPFSYLGRYEDASNVVVILAKGNKVYTVSQGEIIDDTYRVDHISNALVDLVYLPLNIHQSISTVGVSENSQHRFGGEEFNRRP